MEVDKLSHYEVRCPRCNVSFAPETRVCIHCGGRTAASGKGRRRNARMGLPDGGAQSQDDVFVFQSAEGAGPFPSEVEVEDEAEAPRAGFLRTAITIVWVLLAIAFSLMRACSEGE
jgi:hypothetical protein